MAHNPTANRALVTEIESEVEYLDGSDARIRWQHNALCIQCFDRAVIGAVDVEYQVGTGVTAGYLRDQRREACPVIEHRGYHCNMSAHRGGAGKMFKMKSCSQDSIDQILLSFYAGRNTPTGRTK
jgi:hypothetical protein